MSALLLVDLQNDFVAGGALPVQNSEHLVDAVNRLFSCRGYDLVVATKDWHPRNHGSFAKNHAMSVGSKILLEGIEQILWPVHCVQKTQGAEFIPGLNTKAIDCIIYKGTDQQIDSYSAFFDNQHLKSTGLDALLKEHAIQEIYIAGVATDYCVKYTVQDAISLGYRVFIYDEACRGVNLHPDDSEVAIREMLQAGAKLVSL